MIEAAAKCCSLSFDLIEIAFRFRPVSPSQPDNFEFEVSTEIPIRLRDFSCVLFLCTFLFTNG